jgi:hypothetical protein
MFKPSCCSELRFKIVRMHGSQNEVMALVANFLVCKAAFALFVYPGCPVGDASRGADHFEVEGGTAPAKLI